MRLMASSSLSMKPNWPQRRKPPVLWFKKQFLMAVFFGCMFLALGGWVISGGLTSLGSKASDIAFLWTARQGFALQQILVNGRNRLSDTDLQAALAVHGGMPLLAIDIEAARERLLATPWVRQASVSRRLPNQLIVELEEAQPFALWQKGTQLVLIDDKGEAIGAVERNAFPFLPVLAGESAPQQAYSFFQVLRQDQDLYKRIASAILISERRWNLRMNNGVEIKLPEDRPEAAWALLGRLEREQQILERAISAIDLRLPDKIFVEMPSSPLLQKTSEAGNAI